MSDQNTPDANVAAGQSLGYMPIDYTPQRPTSVTALSILGIVFGVLGLICVPLGLVSYFIPSVEQSNPGIAAVKNNVPLFSWVIASNLIGLLMSIVLVIASAGSLMLHNWARQLMLAYSVIGILMAIVITSVNLVWLTPVMTQGVPANMKEVVRISSYVGAAIGLIFGLTLPILNLIFFRKPHVVDAFERRLAV